jgi:hypothetical protein
MLAFWYAAIIMEFDLLCTILPAYLLFMLFEFVRQLPKIEFRLMP